MTNEFFSLLEYAWISDQGKHRSNNEDAKLCLCNDGAFFVADGMGGGDSGEVASHFVVHYLQQNLQNTSLESPGERKQCLNSALNKAHHKIHEYVLAHNYNFMGSTVAGMIFNSWNYPSAILCYAGDSRIYRFRQGHLEQLTIDHTMENDSLFAGKKLDDKFSGVLTHAIGMKGPLCIDYLDIDLQTNDLFLLCTDGLSRTLSNGMIKNVLTTTELKSIPVNLMKAVAQADGKDNTTIIVVKIPEKIPDILKKSDIDIAESKYLEKTER